MSKGEYTIIGVALATCLILFVKLKAHGNTVNASNRAVSSETGNAAADPCGATPCITFLGNIRVGDNFILASKDSALEKKEKTQFFKSLMPLLKSSETVLANLETPLIEKPAPQSADKLLLFWAKKETAAALKKANISAVSLANHHIYDFGETGLEETASALERAGVGFFGLEGSRQETPAVAAADAARTEKSAAEKDAPAEASIAKPLPTVYTQRFSKGDAVFDLAVLNTMEAPPAKSKEGALKIEGLDVIALGERIRDLKAISPLTFVVAYLGNAKVRGPAQPRQQTVARELIDAGADLIVGYGARFLQAVERYNGKWIVYALGDTVTTANLPIPAQNERWPFSGALRLILTEQDGELWPNLKLYPIVNNVVETAYQPRLLSKKAFGDLFWYLLRKDRIQYDFVLKMKLHPGEDTTGRFVSLERGAQ